MSKRQGDPVAGLLTLLAWAGAGWLTAEGLKLLDRNPRAVANALLAAAAEAHNAKPVRVVPDFGRCIG